MHQKATGSKHPKGFLYILTLLMAEFFSYYGSRGLLVLFFTQYLNFSDTHAFTLFGAFTSLVWVTPILGGYLADRFLGYFFCVVTGAVLIFLGNLCFALSGVHINIIYLAMALIICGYGFFKGNISCLAGELYTKNDPRREADFVWLYISGNIGGFIAFIVCGWTYTLIGWHVSFVFAALGLLIGIYIFIAGRNSFQHTRSINKAALKKRWMLLSKGSWILCGSVGTLIVLIPILTYNVAGYLLLIIGCISCLIITSLFIKSCAQERRHLILICFFMLFSFIFWVFNQQNGSSILLFIQRNVSHNLFNIEIPTTTFQTVNSLSVMLGGFLTSWIWNKLRQANINTPSLIKLCCGMITLTMGFFLIAITAKLAVLSPDNKAPMGAIIIGMALIGFGELFVDPIALANITRLNPVNSRGILTGIYLLVTGSFANYAAGELATLTDIQNYAAAGTHLNKATAYLEVFKAISWAGVGTTLLLLIIGFILHRIIKIKE